MKIARVIPAAVALCLALTACGGGAILPHMKEISDFEVARVFGIDKDGDDIKVTLVADRTSVDGESGGGKITEIVSFSGKTVIDAIADMDRHSDKRQHLGYVDFLLIGEDAARDGITKYLDFFSRDYESRYSTNVFIIRDGTAEDFLNDTASEERSIDAALNNIAEEIDRLSSSQFLRIIDLVRVLTTPQQAAIIPALETTEIDFGKMVGGEMPTNTFISAGFAFLRDFTLVDYYDVPHAMAYNFLIDKGRAAPRSVVDHEGNLVALALRSEEIDFTATWDGDTLKGVKFDVRLFANINEQQGSNNIYAADALSALSEALSRSVKADMDAVIAKSQKLGQDGIDLARRVRMKHPVRWDRSGLAERWDEVFPTLSIEVEVSANLRRTYDLREPIGYVTNTASQRQEASK